MKERGFNLKSRTRSQWRLRESRLKWKKKRARRKRVLKIAFFIVEVIGIIFCISTGISIEETSAYAKSTIVVFQDEEPEMEEIFEEKKCEIKEFDANTDLKSEIYIIGEKVESTEASQIEETDAETESALETEEAEDATIVEELIAEHTISYPGSVSSSSYENRNKNMELAAAAINDYVIESGNRFYWSKVVGKTTAEKGYLIAGVIKNRKSTKDLGGGVCQVSSTLYSAVYDAGIIQKGKYYAKKHTKTSAYINPKVDHEATVAVDHEPITDFWFENTLEYPIRINAETDKYTVIVRIYLLKTE